MALSNSSGTSPTTGYGVETITRSGDARTGRVNRIPRSAVADSWTSVDVGTAVARAGVATGFSVAGAGVTTCSSVAVGGAVAPVLSGTGAHADSIKASPTIAPVTSTLCLHRFIWIPTLLD
jgi:hypothetical protein